MHPWDRIEKAGKCEDVALGTFVELVPSMACTNALHPNRAKE